MIHSHGVKHLPALYVPKSQRQLSYPDADSEGRSAMLQRVLGWSLYGSQPMGMIVSTSCELTRGAVPSRIKKSVKLLSARSVYSACPSEGITTSLSHSLSITLSEPPPPSLSV